MNSICFYFYFSTSFCLLLIKTWEIIPNHTVLTQESISYKNYQTANIKVFHLSSLAWWFTHWIKMNTLQKRKIITGKNLSWHQKLQQTHPVNSKSEKSDVEGEVSWTLYHFFFVWNTVSSISPNHINFLLSSATNIKRKRIPAHKLVCTVPRGLRLVKAEWFPSTGNKCESQRPICWCKEHVRSALRDWSVSLMEFLFLLLEGFQ